MPPCRYRIGALPALLCLCIGMIWTGVAAETQAEIDTTPPPSSPSPSPAIGNTDRNSPRGRGPEAGLGPRVGRGPEAGLGPGVGMSAAGDLLESVLAQKDHLFSQTGGMVLPSALPQDLLPLLGREMSTGGLSGGLSLDQQGLLKRIQPPVSQPHDSGSPLPSQLSQPDSNPLTSSSQPVTHTPPGQRDEVTTIVTATVDADTDMDAETPSPAVSGCMVNFSDPEGYIDSSDDPPLPDGTFLHCTYTVTVYTGYGVELQVKSVNLSEGEQLSIRGVDEGGALLVLANHTLLVEGQVIRSPTNTISVYYRSSPEGSIGMFQLHYQIFRLSCALPRRPHFGEVSVLDLLPGGTARFHCHMGYHLQGAVALTCLNTSMPVWSSKEPSCRALCGGSVKNATVGRILSPSPRLGPTTTHDRSCSWSLEAPTAQRLHLHLERLVLEPTDRLVLWSGLDAGSVVLFDSGRGGPIPFEGVISEGPAVRVQFITDQPNHNTGFNIRYEAFERGHCYEPYLQNGNFSTTDQVYGVGAVVQFSCDPGHSLEQGPPIIECINARDPYWNDTEPLCKALCGGDLAGPVGVILSPNWPEWYGEGEDCSWRIHVEEDKRVLLNVQLLLRHYLTLTEESVSCENPGLPDNGYQVLSKRLYLPGESLTFVCYQGYELIGEVAIKCILGNPSFWSGPLPLCRANHDCFGNHALEVAEAAAGSGLDGGNMALAIFILVLLLSVLLGGAYVYVTRCRYNSNLRLPLIHPHPYSQITVESEFDNPLYETGGDTREYEVSI
ncbi:seizure 6-like protein [Oncorhynchus kisutch]|uniref:seizure 6-like protein n=1 Tax=Oncorhynchus kisutch TaxID=8019 RepID=UPI0012DF17D1|nr:seizure 6-like protein [Oncorhynchus kisutch]